LASEQIPAGGSWRTITVCDARPPTVVAASWSTTAPALLVAISEGTSCERMIHEGSQNLESD
jgi:hypothetical protein